MEGPYATFLEKTRLPQPSFQRFAVVSLFRRLEAASSSLGLASNAGRDAVSHCLRSPFAPVVDQTVRELCRLVAAGGGLPTSDAFIELQSALEGCDSCFAPVFIKGIGFLCRFAFRTDPSWGRRFDQVELHPFVKVLSSQEEFEEVLIQQVLLFIAHSMPLGIDDVVRFLRPFILFSVTWKPSSARSYFFARDLIAAIASLSSSFPLKFLSIMKLLMECLKYLPSTNAEEFKFIVSSSEYLVDGYVVLLQHSVGTEKELASDAQRCSLEVLSMLLSVCASLKWKLQGQVEPVLGLCNHLLGVQKALGLPYTFEMVNIVVSASVVLTHVDLEHEQISILKLLNLLMEWKNKELSNKSASCYFREELFLVFPVINLLSSPSQSVKAATSRLLLLAESFILGFTSASKETKVFCTGFPAMSKLEYIPLRLLHYLLFQDHNIVCCSYFSVLTCNMVPNVKESCYGRLHWTSQFTEYVLNIERGKATSLPEFSKEHFDGINLLLGSIVSSLILCPLATSAVDSLVALGLHDPKLCMTLFQAALFYNKVLCNFGNNSSEILFSLLDMLPPLASHSAMGHLIVQTILCMLQNHANQSLHAIAIRMLCKTWMHSDGIFETLQDALDPKIFSHFSCVREICLSIAASVRDVCKHNPDRGVDLILSVSSCIESPENTVKALGLESLAYLCEADVVDFYTAWEVIEKDVNSYAEDPIVATRLGILLRWGAMDFAAYPDSAKSILLKLWKIGTFKRHSCESLWVKARTTAFRSLVHYEILFIQETIPDFKEKCLQCLLNEDNAEVLEAIKEFEVKTINFEHINRRRVLKERKPLGLKVQKLLDVFPQVLFSAEARNRNVSARELPGAALLLHIFSPKESRGTSSDSSIIHEAFEKALLEIAESITPSRNLFIALLVLQSWKAFNEHWMNALVSSADASDDMQNNFLKNASYILKIFCKVALHSAPQVSTNIALAIGALCLVVPSSSYSIISSGSDFLLNWLLETEHEHHQWSAAISLGLICNCFHVTDRKKKYLVIDGLLKIASNSESHLVIGACGIGLGFACQGLISSSDVNDPNRLTEIALLHNVIRTISTVLSELCPSASGPLKDLTECFLPDDYDACREDSSILFQRHLDTLEEDAWGVAGLVLGLGYSVKAIHRFGASDAVLKIKNTLLSWVPPNDLSIKGPCFVEITKLSLATGACLAIPIVVELCQKNELFVGEIDSILSRYYLLISNILSLKNSGALYQNLLMASCIGAGSFVSCILNLGVDYVRYEDIKDLLDILRNCYSKSSPPLVLLGGMLGVVNAFGAAAGDLIYNHLHPSILQISHRQQESSLVRGPILLNPICENLSATFVQELFFIAKESKDQQIKKFAAWAVSFLRHRWWSNQGQKMDGFEGISRIFSLPSQSLAEDSLIWKMCLWLTNINYYQVHPNTIVAIIGCLSKAPRLPALDWASVVRGCMYNAAQQTKKSQKQQQAANLLREECIYFSLTRAKDFRSLLLFLDELADLSRFRTLEINLQCLLLSHVFELQKIFSGLRMVRLFEDLIHCFSSSGSAYFVCDPDQNVSLRVSLWKGLYQCLNEGHAQLSCVSKIENCLECLFCLLPVFVYDAKSESSLSISSEWSEAIRCLDKARRDWLMDILQVSSSNISTEMSKRAFAQVRLVKIGGLPFSEMEKLKSYMFNTRLEVGARAEDVVDGSQSLMTKLGNLPDGMWWSVLVEVVAALSMAEINTRRQWLLDALEISCITEYPSTAMRFIGLLSGGFCKYMPMLIVDPEIVLSDLPVTLPSLLASSGWSSIAESAVSMLCSSTERICMYGAAIRNQNNPNPINEIEAHGAAIRNQNDPNPINESEAHASSFLARVMHETCLSLKDFLPVKKRLGLANLLVP
ncbi:hypothetical protein AXF42_Ash004414 [Apostasia shenzhenica]|uniref:DUF3730 domain-containing protein n=1 Tax=Apostasia shenzhenica TaxID=1088818 RepID=A0A2I0A2U1_9ASPA|nr:hypothetical protein AXF42_Ash004414 [Apostasia shenzhenica]